MPVASWLHHLQQLIQSSCHVTVTLNMGKKYLKQQEYFSFFFFFSLYARELFIFMYKGLLPQVLIFNTSILLFIITK